MAKTLEPDTLDYCVQKVQQGLDSKEKKALRHLWNAVEWLIEDNGKKYPTWSEEQVKHRYHVTKQILEENRHLVFGDRKLTEQTNITVKNLLNDIEHLAKTPSVNLSADILNFIQHIRSAMGD
jgi:hypothetical protein